MGNYFSSSNSPKDPKVKCNDARTKIQHAREKYLKKLLEDEAKAKTENHDELDGPVKGKKT